MMSRGAERQLNMELVNLWHKAKNQEFCMYFGTDKNRTPAQPIAKQNVPDARTGFSQRISLLLFYHKGRGIYISKLFLYQKIKF